MITESNPPSAVPPERGIGINPWWSVIVLAVLAGGILSRTMPGDQNLRILAIFAPTLVAGFLGMVLAEFVPLRARLILLGVALVLAIPAYFFVRTGIGVSYVEAQFQMADLQETPVDSTTFRAKFQRCGRTARIFPELRPAWGQSASMQMQDAAREAERGNAAKAKTRMEALDNDLAEFSPWANKVAVELESQRRTIKECWLRQVPLAQLRDLPGRDSDTQSRLWSQFQQVENGQFPDLVKEFKDAERNWVEKATKIVAKEALDLAGKDDLDEANRVIWQFRSELYPRNLLVARVVEDLKEAKKQVIDTVWQGRLNALRSTLAEDVAGYRKRRDRCRAIVDSTPEAIDVLATAEKVWLEKSAQAAATAAKELVQKGKLDEAQQVLVLRFQQLSDILEFKATQGPATLREGRGKVLTVRLENAASELKVLADAKKLAELAKLALHSDRAWRAEAKAIGAEKELSGFLIQCVGVILSDDCRAVEKLLSDGDASLDAAGERVKKIARDHEELIHLVGGPGMLAEYNAFRRRVVQVHLKKAKRDFAELETLNKQTEVALRANRLLKEWHGEAISIGLGDESWKVLTDSAQVGVSAAVKLAHADQEKLRLESAYQRLHTIGQEWAPLLQEEDRRDKEIGSLHKMINLARQRLALATLSDAKMNFKTLLKAKDYAGLEKMKLSLDARKELSGWGAGEALQKFLNGCDFYIHLARDAGEIPP